MHDHVCFNILSPIILYLTQDRVIALENAIKAADFPQSDETDYDTSRELDHLCKEM